MNNTSDAFERSASEQDAIAIWQAGVDAVLPAPLVNQALRVEAAHLVVGAQRLPLDGIDRVVIVGAGKAVDGMAAGALAALRRHPIKLSGWINAIGLTHPQTPPALEPLHRHIARTPGINEPTAEAVRGTTEILRRVRELGPRDVCLCLLSGGGSAMLVAPPDGVTLDDKLDVTRRLSATGASIEQLNTVRRCLSRVKGGALAQACGARHLFTLVISDVLGDALETIASGPTVIGSANPHAALDVLQQFTDEDWQPPKAVVDYLQNRAEQQAKSNAPATGTAHAEHLLLANIQTAIDAAAGEAQRRGYQVQKLSVQPNQPTANAAGRQLADQLLAVRSDQRMCIVSGGEPTVTLADASRRGLGGRNQQLALAALQRVDECQAAAPREFAFLSGGTDGEDGPTDAAGAIFGAKLLARAEEDRAAIERCLAHNDAYSFFEPRGALLKTGPTGTNVCDLRVIVAEPQQPSVAKLYRLASS